MKGEKKKLGNHNYLVALREGWITNKYNYIGRGKNVTSKQIDEHFQLIPIKRINAEIILEKQIEQLNHLSTRINNMSKINKDILELIKNKTYPLQPKRNK